MTNDITTEVSDPEPKWSRIFAIIAAIVVTLMLVISYSQYQLVSRFSTPKSEDSTANQPNLDALGVSGDFFGMQTAFFSALAFAAFIVTLMMQNHELKQQRRELRYTRDTLKLQIKEFQENRIVLREQKGELQAQREAMQQQLFESTLFELISVFLTCRKEVCYNSSYGEKAVCSIYSSRVDQILRSKELSNNQRKNLSEFLLYQFENFRLSRDDNQSYFSSYTSVWMYFNKSNYYQEVKYHTILWGLLSPLEKQLFAIESLFDNDFFNAIGEEHITRKLPDLALYKDALHGAQAGYEPPA